MKRLWIVTELFYPEETSTAFILTKIANHLAEGMDVNVICGPSSYEGDGTCAHEGDGLDRRVKVHRVSETKLDKNSLPKRLLRFIMLTWKLTRAMRKRVSDGDEVLVVTNPAPILLSVASMRRRRNFTLSLLVHDVFPENTIPAGIIKSGRSLLYRMLKGWFDKSYAAADRLIVLGRDMKDVVCCKIGTALSDKITIIENWADVEGIKPIEQSGAEKVVLQYAGNLGRVQGLMELLNYVKTADNKDLEFAFYGTGAVKPAMEKFVQDNEMGNVSFFSSYKRNEQQRVLNACDLAIVTLADGMYGLGVPSKTYNILAAGKPVLFIGDEQSEIALLIKEHGLGYVFKSSDSEAITEFLRGLSVESLPALREMGKLSRDVAVSMYSQEVILNKFSDLLIKG